MSNIDQTNEDARRVKHDLRAPLVNIQGFAAELGESFANVTALIELHQSSLPGEFKDQVSKLLEEDLVPCLDFLDKAVAQLDQRIDTLAVTNIHTNDAQKGKG